MPLNANNVLCVEDEGPAALWEAKIRETLNKDRGQYKTTLVKSLREPHSQSHNMDVDVMVTDVPEVSNVDRLLAELSRTNFQEGLLSAAEEVIVHNRNVASLDQNGNLSFERPLSCRKAALDGSPTFPPNVLPEAENPRQLYSRVASNQMVGLFITVWIRSHLWRHVHNVQVSTVGCGLMNHLGNKVRTPQPLMAPRGFKCEGLMSGLRVLKCSLMCSD